MIKKQSCGIAEKTKMYQIDVQRLLEIVIYEPATGIYRWRIDRGCGIRAGKIAGSANSWGYVYLKLDGVKYLAQRIAFLYMTGTMPESDIDHVNGNRSDNRWENLRLSTRSQNAQNQKKAQSRNVASGLLGVFRKYGKNNWGAKICLDGKITSLGTFDTPEAAHQAYLEEKRKVHPFGTL